MSKTLLALAFFIVLATLGAAPYIMNRYQLQTDDVISTIVSTLPSQDSAKQENTKPESTKTNGSMTTKQLLELAKTDPGAFDAYVMAHINDSPPEDVNSKGKAAEKAAFMEKNTAASGVDRTVMEFYLSHLDHSEHTTLEKMLNWLSHGEYK